MVWHERTKFGFLWFLALLKVLKCSEMFQDSPIWQVASPQVASPQVVHLVHIWSREPLLDIIAPAANMPPATVWKKKRTWHWSILQKSIGLNFSSRGTYFYRRTGYVCILFRRTCFTNYHCNPKTEQESKTEHCDTQLEQKRRKLLNLQDRWWRFHGCFLRRPLCDLQDIVKMVE